MGIPPDVAKGLSYWEFTALRHEWVERHRDPNAPDNGDPVEPPDVETVRARQRELAALGISG